MREGIPVIVALPPDQTTTKGILDKAVSKVTAVVQVDPVTLRSNLAELFAKISQVTEGALPRTGGFVVAEFEIGLEISAEGGLAIIGTAGANASVKVVFKRQS